MASDNFVNIGSDNGLLPYGTKNHYLSHCWLIISKVKKHSYERISQELTQPSTIQLKNSTEIFLEMPQGLISHYMDRLETILCIMADVNSILYYPFSQLGNTHCPYLQATGTGIGFVN